MLPEEPGHIYSMAPFANSDQMVLSGKDFHLNGPVYYCLHSLSFFFSVRKVPNLVQQQCPNRSIRHHINLMDTYAKQENPELVWQWATVQTCRLEKTMQGTWQHLVEQNCTDKN